MNIVTSGGPRTHVEPANASHQQITDDMDVFIWCIEDYTHLLTYSLDIVTLDYITIQVLDKLLRTGSDAVASGGPTQQPNLLSPILWSATRSNIIIIISSTINTVTSFIITSASFVEKIGAGTQKIGAGTKLR